MSETDESDAGAPLPNFSASNIQLQTVAPALGVRGRTSPDYLDYDPKGRGVFVKMCANSGLAYMMGIAAGGIYGLKTGIASTPSNRFRVQLNSVLNHSGRYGSRAGNMLGVFAVLYSCYEGLADHYDFEDKLQLRSVSPMAASMVAPAFGATMTGLTYYGPSGPRVAALAGAIGFVSVGATYAAYSVLGIPYGSKGFMFF